MSIFNLFSKRQKELRGEIPDVYRYDEMPEQLRTQIAYILRDVLGNSGFLTSATEGAFRRVHEILCREYGQFALTAHPPDTFIARIFDFLIAGADVEQVLDAIEVTLTLAESLHDSYNFRSDASPALQVPEAIHELNHRFREHGVGYQYENGQVVRVDSQLLHQQAVRPALAFLSEKRFAGANAEFLAAHEHYRHGRHKECMVECLKALESTLKVICRSRAWPYAETDTASRLLAVVFEQKLIPAFLQSEFSSLRSSLESGIPTTRNRLAGHGQGEAPIQVPEHLTAYLLHLTASSILFLIQADRSWSGA